MIKLKEGIQGVYDFYFEEYGIVFSQRFSEFIKRDETQDGDWRTAGCRYGFFEALTVVVVCHNSLLVSLGCVSLAEKVYLNDALKRPSEDLVIWPGTHGQGH